MKIDLSAEKMAALIKRLQESEDAQTTGTDEYALDVYDAEPPMSFELALLSDGVDVLAAAELLYDESLGGYYMGEQRFDVPILKETLIDWIGTCP